MSKLASTMCKGKTEDGRPCRNHALLCGYCTVHFNMWHNKGVGR